MRTRNLYFLCLAAVLAIGLTAGGCSNRNKILKEVSGQWQDIQDNSTVEINLVGDNTSLTVEGKNYPVTVDKVEEINFLVQLKVQNGSAQPELWTLKQMWDSNGGGFKLAFDRSGEKEVLIPKQQS